MTIRSVAAALWVAAALLGAQPGQAQMMASDSTHHGPSHWPGHDGDRIGELRLIGQATLPHGLDFQGTVVGGLSGLDWDPVNARWTALSDDRSANGPARFYTLAIDYDAQAVRGIRVTGVTPLRYVTELRMRLAAQWIGRDRVPIDAAAHRLGYGSQAAFSRAFKRVVGRSPGAVRAAALGQARRAS